MVARIRVVCATQEESDQLREWLEDRVPGLKLRRGQKGRNPKSADNPQVLAYGELTVELKRRQHKKVSPQVETPAQGKQKPPPTPSRRSPPSGEKPATPRASRKPPPSGEAPSPAPSRRRSGVTGEGQS